MYLAVSFNRFIYFKNLTNFVLLTSCFINIDVYKEFLRQCKKLTLSFHILSTNATLNTRCCEISNYFNSSSQTISSPKFKIKYFKTFFIIKAMILFKIKMRTYAPVNWAIGKGKDVCSIEGKSKYSLTNDMKEKGSHRKVGVHNRFSFFLYLTLIIKN